MLSQNSCIGIYKIKMVVSPCPSTHTCLPSLDPFAYPNMEVSNLKRDKASDILGVGMLFGLGHAGSSTVEEMANLGAMIPICPIIRALDTIRVRHRYYTRKTSNR